ncbi:MAG: M15 family metallopeptidase [Microcoleaceae cyanobacterium]
MGLPNNSHTLSEATVDDIPEAVRDLSPKETEPTSMSQSKRKWRFGLMLGLGLLAFALTIGLNYYDHFSLLVSRFGQTAAISTPSSDGSQTPWVPQETVSQPAKDSSSNSDNLLGHLPYEEASPDDLKKVTADGEIKLQPEAAEAFLKMSDAARAKGINLVPISGFRTLADQEYLFFGIKAQRGQNASKRAEVSAPPGYSEHHTGYAIDIGDRDQPDTHLSVDFEQTKAFQWLAENAAFHSFELSFPEGNTQGVSYEPWHWRYVGNRDSLETFYQAPSRTTGAESSPSE